MYKRIIENFAENILKNANVIYEKIDFAKNNEDELYEIKNALSHINSELNYVLERLVIDEIR